MILINANQSNTVALTLNEKQPIANVDWLFEFTNDITGGIKLFTATDSSTATERYNLFTITDNMTENPYSGTMYFRPVGYWSYKIYAMTQSSPVNLDPLTAISMVESGKVLIKEQDVITPNFDDDDTINNAIFDL